jgi:hypothetical protein
LFRSAWRSTRNVYENDRQFIPPKRFNERAGSVDHFSYGVDELRADDALLKVNDDESGLGIECREGQWTVLL